jgi:imidazoleglycerol-phosphate dehydratase
MRTAKLERNTKETKIQLELNLDGTSCGKFQTQVPFFEHMLEQITKNSGIDLTVVCNGDNHIDDHHTVEDIGILLGQAVNQALGDKKGIERYAFFKAPLDESLAEVVIDISGRSHLTFNANFASNQVKNFDVQLVKEFFVAFSSNAKITIHIDLLRGENTHHQIEAIFKAFGRAFKQAIKVTGTDIPSTKGVLV